jgi:small subunit ribosomal protein S5
MQLNKSIYEWVPKTYLGQLVKNGTIKKFEDLKNYPYPVLEIEIIDYFNLDLTKTIVSTRRVFKPVKSGRILSYSVHLVLTGSNYLGVGSANAASTLLATNLAIKKAKLNLLFIKKGHKYNENTIPRTTFSKEGSTIIKLEPVNRGTGIVCAPKYKTMLKNITNLELRIKKKGNSNPINYISALYNAFKTLK